MSKTRDHGGGLDATVAKYGGTRSAWLDLSTGINPQPYPVGDIPPEAWSALPDQGAMDRLLAAARTFWNVPDGAEIVAANGASAIIAAMPRLWPAETVSIPTPTYNEHAAAFRAAGTQVNTDGEAPVHVVVHPNNPDGRLWDLAHQSCKTVIDESFCDVCPQHSHIAQATSEDRVILKSFGKFWGLAGARLGFAICSPQNAQTLREILGPWAVSGPALDIGARALRDIAWAGATRQRLADDVVHMDRMVGLPLVGGTDLFRLYEVKDAAAAQDHLAHHHVWSRIFPYSKTWLRLGLPAVERWSQLETAVADLR